MKVVSRRPKPKTVPSSKMKAFLETGRRESRLLGPVERHLLSQPPDDRSTTVLHPSEMAKSDWCHLASYHLLRGATPQAEVTRLVRENIFDEGHEYHRKWQARLADMGVLVGRWWCLGCTRAEEQVVRPAACTFCGATGLMQYREVSLRSPEHRIAGHADGWVTGLGDDCLIEIKSIGTGTIRMEQPSLLAKADNDLDEVWKNIRRPFPSHYRQGQIYLALAALQYGTSAPREIVFIYEYKLNGAVKEFVVEADPDAVFPMFDAALDIVYAVKKGRPVPCPNGGTEGCAQCRPFTAAA